MRSLIVSDWNGTLFSHPTEEQLNKSIAYAVLGDARQAWGHGDYAAAFPLTKLAATKVVTKAALVLYKTGILPPRAVYAPFNAGVIRGQPVDYIHQLVDVFAREHASDVDGRTARPLRRARERGGQVGILSVGLDYGIQRLLEEAGYADILEDDLLVANRLETDGNGVARRITLDIHGKKAEAMEQHFFREGDFRPGHTYYVGDSMDDAPIANLLPRGHFIVPRYMLEGFPQLRDHEKDAAFLYQVMDDGARVAMNEAELDRMLKG